MTVSERYSKSIDYAQSPFEITPGRVIMIDRTFLQQALRTKNIELNSDEYVFREKYIDRSFEFFETVQHFIENNLMVFEDISFRFEYYVSRIVQDKELMDAVNDYIKIFGFSKAGTFLQKFSSWKRASKE